MNENKKELQLINEDPLNQSTKEIVSKLMVSENEEDTKALIDLFNINMSKKNALRIVKLNELLDTVNEQAANRFHTQSEEITNMEILKYMEVVQNAIDRSQKNVDLLKQQPMIQINKQTNNEVNINMGIGNGLDRESKEKVIDALGKLFQNLKDNNNNYNIDNDSVIDVEETIATDTVENGILDEENDEEYDSFETGDDND